MVLLMMTIFVCFAVVADSVLVVEVVVVVVVVVVVIIVVVVVVIVVADGVAVACKNDGNRLVAVWMF